MMPRVLSSHSAASAALSPGGTAGGKQAEGTAEQEAAKPRSRGLCHLSGLHFAAMHRSSELGGNPKTLCFNNLFCFLRDNQDQKGNDLTVSLGDNPGGEFRSLASTSSNGQRQNSSPPNQRQVQISSKLPEMAQAPWRCPSPDRR